MVSASNPSANQVSMSLSRDPGGGQRSSPTLPVPREENSRFSPARGSSRHPSVLLSPKLSFTIEGQGRGGQ